MLIFNFNYAECEHFIPTTFLDVFYDLGQRPRPSKDPVCLRHIVKYKQFVNRLVAHDITQNGSFNLRLVYPNLWEK